MVRRGLVLQVSQMAIFFCLITCNAQEKEISIIYDYYSDGTIKDKVEMLVHQ